MTAEKYEQAQQLAAAISHLVWEINMLESAENFGTLAVYPKGLTEGNYRVVIEKEQAAKAIREWLEAKRAELAEKRAEFERL